MSSGGTASDLGIAAGGTAFAGDGAALSGTLTDDGALIATETGTLQIVAEINGGGAVAQAGPGTLVLEGGANGYSGGTTISAGTLQLDGRGAAGTGAITFAPGANATLRLDVSPLPANIISGFGRGDAIDLPGVVFDPTATVIAKGNIVTITEPSGTTDHLVIAGAGTQGGFALSQASDGGTQLTTTNAPITAATVQAAGVGDAPQFLGGSTAQAGAAAGPLLAPLQGAISQSDLVSSLVASTWPGDTADALFGAPATPSVGSGLPPGGETAPAGALAQLVQAAASFGPNPGLVETQMLNGLTTSAGLAVVLAPAGHPGALA